MQESALYNTFNTPDDLMHDVEVTTSKLQRDILAAVEQAKSIGGEHYLGDLSFKGVDFGVVYRPKTVKVFFVPYWGLMYEYKNGTHRYSNNNGSVHDLLRNSDPHGLPTHGSSFTNRIEKA